MCIYTHKEQGVYILNTQKYFHFTLNVKHESLAGFVNSLHSVNKYSLKNLYVPGTKC